MGRTKLLDIFTAPFTNPQKVGMFIYTVAAAAAAVAAVATAAAAAAVAAAAAAVAVIRACAAQGRTMELIYKFVAGSTLYSKP